MKNERRPGIIAAGNLYAETYLFGLTNGGPDGDKPWIGTEYKQRAAGSAVTFARTIATLGVPVILFGKVGNDDNGRWLERELARTPNLEPVLLSSPDPRVQTNIGFHAIPECGKGEKRMNGGSANQQLAPGEIYEAAREKKDDISYFYSGGALKQPQILHHLGNLFESLHSQGIKVMLDHGNVPDGFTDQSRDHLKEAMKFVDVYFPSKEEAIELWAPELKHLVNSMDPQELAIRIIERISKIAPDTTIVLKDGANGAFGMEPGGDPSEDIVHVDALDVPIEHRVGAGDSFNAGFAYGLLHGLPFEESLLIASAVSAYRIAIRDGEPPTREEIAQIMKLFYLSKLPTTEAHI